MSQKLTVNGFKWVKRINFTEDFNNNYDGNSSIALALTILNN